MTWSIIFSTYVLKTDGCTIRYIKCNYLQFHSDLKRQFQLHRWGHLNVRDSVCILLGPTRADRFYLSLSNDSESKFSIALVSLYSRKESGYSYYDIATSFILFSMSRTRTAEKISYWSPKAGSEFMKEFHSFTHTNLALPAD